MAQKNFADAMNQIVNGTNGLRSQINVKADKNSPAFTGTPTAPTADNDTDSNQLATTEFVQNLIRRLVGSAPETLNTLVELATAINNDPKIAETITQALDGKLNKTDAASTYLTKTDAESTYLKKSDGLDTSDLVQTTKANTFLAEQTFSKGIKIGDATLSMKSGTFEINVDGSFLRFTGAGNILFCKKTDTSKAYALSNDGTWG